MMCEVTGMELIMLVGIPGSGKSTFATFCRMLGYSVRSSDAIREELYGSEETQGKPSEVFEVMIERARSDLRAGRSVVLDASNLSRKRRMNTLGTLSKHANHKKCVLVLAKPEECLARNEKRARTVPPEKINDMLCAFEAPYWYEGWDEIEAIYGEERYVFPRDEAAGFQQDNPHHRLTLGAHLDLTRDYCVSQGFSEAVCEAAWYHDIGKLYTRRFVNRKGEPTDIAHFYGHESYGAYLYLCEKAKAAVENGTWNDVLYIASLINWHMRWLNVWRNTPSAEARDRQLIGEAMYADLERLREADMAAH